MLRSILKFYRFSTASVVAWRGRRGLLQGRGGWLAGLSLLVIVAGVGGCATIEKDEAAAAPEPVPAAPTPTPAPSNHPRPRGYNLPRQVADAAPTPLPDPAGQPAPESAPEPTPTPLADPQTIAAANQDREIALESGKPVRENPEADRSFPERKSPEELGEERGEIRRIDENDPLFEIYQEHGIDWPMVANAGSSKVYDKQKGIASFYSKPQKTASGDWFDPSGLTAAHKTLPFGTLVRCTMDKNGKSVTVMINDRGPFIRGRIIDLSKAAAQKIGLHRYGISRVTLEVVAYPLIETRGPKGNG